MAFHYLVKRKLNKFLALSLSIIIVTIEENKNPVGISRTARS